VIEQPRALLAAHRLDAARALPGLIDQHGGGAAAPVRMRSAFNGRILRPVRIS
jgi:hypothetical protein